MKSKYAPLVKLKKQALDKAEQELMKANRAVEDVQLLLDEAYTALSQMSPPASGSASMFSQSRHMLQSQHDLISASKEQLQQAQSHQSRMRTYFKQAMMEYEKFNYLEVQEVNAEKKKIKAEESKMLDEIGTMIFKPEEL